MNKRQRESEGEGVDSVHSGTSIAEAWQSHERAEERADPAREKETEEEEKGVEAEDAEDAEDAFCIEEGEIIEVSIHADRAKRSAVVSADGTKESEADAAALRFVPEDNRVIWFGGRERPFEQCVVLDAEEAKTWNNIFNIRFMRSAEKVITQVLFMKCGDVVRVLANGSLNFMRTRDNWSEQTVAPTGRMPGSTEISEVLHAGPNGIVLRFGCDNRIAVWERSTGGDWRFSIVSNSSHGESVDPGHVDAKLITMRGTTWLFTTKGEAGTPRLWFKNGSTRGFQEEIMPLASCFDVMLDLQRGRVHLVGLSSANPATVLWVCADFTGILTRRVCDTVGAIAPGHDVVDCCLLFDPIRTGTPSVVVASRCGKMNMIVPVAFNADIVFRPAFDTPIMIAPHVISFKFQKRFICPLTGSSILVCDFLADAFYVGVLRYEPSTSHLTTMRIPGILSGRKARGIWDSIANRFVLALPDADGPKFVHCQRDMATIAPPSDSIAFDQTSVMARLYGTERLAIIDCAKTDADSAIVYISNEDGTMSF